MTPASTQVIELAASAAWLHELRDASGEWTRSPGHSVGQGVRRYAVPDHARLINPRADHPDPADYPFFKAHPVSAANIVAAYDAAPPQVRAQGMRWYTDVHDLASRIAGGDAREGAILLGTYSPHVSWPVNMLNAMRAADQHKPLAAGDGLVSGDMVKKAQAALDGKSVDEALHSPKVRSFAHLIERGDDAPDDPYGHVVIDRHALSVATGGWASVRELNEAPVGRDVRAHEYVADAYRAAARQVSERDGQLIKPHQIQAVTWLVQQAANQAQDAEGAKAAGGRLNRGRVAMTRNAWKKWMTVAQAHGMRLDPGVTSLAAQITELLAEQSITGQIELAFNPQQPRDIHGRWTRGFTISGQLERSGEPPRMQQAISGFGHHTTGPLTPGPSTRMSQNLQVAPPITAAEARGNSRPVTNYEFQKLAARGRDQLAALSHPAPVSGLDQHWGEIKARTYVKVQGPWGGATIDAHTGQALETGADKYALAVKPHGMSAVSVPETASEAEFSQAMDRALATFRGELQKAQRHLGVFHDDGNHRIDIDPVLVVSSIPEVESVGAYTHAVGGAYHFRSGDGFWPPHVAEGVQMASGDDQRVHFDGPGQWRSQADEVQPGLTAQQQAEIDLAARDSITGQMR